MHCLISLVTNLLDIVINATPQTMLQIQPRRNRNAVRNCRKATHVFEHITFCFDIVLYRIALPQSVVRPATNVPGIEETFI